MFILPSLLGIAVFMMPVFTKNGMTFPLALMATLTKSVLGDHIGLVVIAVLIVSALLSIVGSLAKPKWMTQASLLNSAFVTTPGWLAIRVLGAVFAIITQQKFGSEIIWSGNTGGLVFNDLLPSLFVTFFLAGFLLPLLLSFGLLELLGTLMSKIMRPVFRLPGRSAIDCISSWLGDGTVGIMLTSSQYENKQYTAREASVVATMFSIVGISFSLVVLTQVNLQAMFVPFYLSICLSGVIAAILLQRIPPPEPEKRSVY